jgi:DNA-binding transcriptional MerR regulator
MTVWTTRQAADKCGLSQYTLRWYERIGLLEPVQRGPDGRRRFTDRDLDWLVLLCKLRATGMSVRDMQRYAELVRSGAGERERLDLLKRHREIVRQAITDRQECLQLLDNKIRVYSRDLRAADQTAGHTDGRTADSAAGKAAQKED